MTLIECFTDFHLDNIAACLYFQPEKLVLLGDCDQMDAPVQRYRDLLRRHGLSTRITQCDIRGTDFKKLCQVLSRLVQEDMECIIDLTGGDELVTMAVGAVYAGLEASRRQQVRVEKFDHRTGKAVECLDGCRILPGKPVQLTVEDVIAIHGGSLLKGPWQPPAEKTGGELDRLWSVVSDEPKDWNRSIALLNEFESRAGGGMDIELPLDRLKNSITRFEEKESTVLSLLEKLQRRGVIRDRSSRYVLRYSYESPLLRYCTQKAGNVLEVKTLQEGRSVTVDGKPFFQDCRMSVSIDWDGVFHAPAKRIPETRNEIDVVMLHGTVPLFISCKNGTIGEEELYKLHTVAHRFAGSHARKMLIATELNQKNASSNRAFIQRAWDMDIFLVTDAAALSKEEWRQLFIQAMQ